MARATDHALDDFHASGFHALGSTQQPSERHGSESNSAEAPEDYDIVVIGGAFTGSSAALLLRRWLPSSRVLIVERKNQFDRKVGEATVELTCMFLCRVLGLGDYLSREHLPKHGLRYWFSGAPDDELSKLSEVGPKAIPGLPAFFLDRAKLDEDLLAMAADAGAEILRPARVAKADLGWPKSHIQIEVTSPDGAIEQRSVTARWVLDASGRQAFIGRRLGLTSKVTEHPTAALWARFRGALPLDGPELAGPDPLAPRLPQISAMRCLATNHFCGYGWWSWVIPLQDGSTSVGVVYDKDLLEWPSEGSPRERFETFVHSQPGLRDILEHAEIDRDDFHSFGHLPYRTEKYMAKGWALLGDAAGFLDPYYSPGLDHSVISVFATAKLLRDDLSGKLSAEALDERIEKHDRMFLRSFHRWMQALYVGKYEILGDAELTTAAFLIDTALYYTFIVTPVHTTLEKLELPLFGDDHPATGVAFRTMRMINTRLKHLARFRRAVGLYGKRNRGWRLLVSPFKLRFGSLGLLALGLLVWARAEVETLGARLKHGLIQRPKATRVRISSTGVAEPVRAAHQTR